MEAKHIIDLMLIEQKHNYKSQTILQSLLHILLAQIQRCVNTENEKISNKKYLIIFKKFKILIDQNFSTNETASFFAENLNITAHHLNIISKYVTGKTASQVISGRRILEAKRLLTFSDKTISEIAFQLNYTDSSYFAKKFKAETNQSPLNFKNQMSEMYRTL